MALLKPDTYSERRLRRTLIDAMNSMPRQTVHLLRRCRCFRDRQESAGGLL